MTPRPREFLILAAPFLCAVAFVALTIVAPGTEATALARQDDPGECCRPYQRLLQPHGSCSCDAECAAATVCPCPDTTDAVVDADCHVGRTGQTCSLIDTTIGVYIWSCDIAACIYQPSPGSGLSIGGECVWGISGVTEIPVKQCAFGSSLCQ